MVRRWQSSEEILKELGENATEAAKSALAEGAELVMKEAKERCPVYTGNDRRVVKGALKEFVHAVKLKGGAKYTGQPPAVAGADLRYNRTGSRKPAFAGRVAYALGYVAKMCQ